METSILIAKIASVIYLACGVALINNNMNLDEAYKSLEKSKLNSTYLGIFDIVIGTLIVSYHNFWSWDWTVLITIIGWVLLVEGVCYILFPKTLLAIYRKLPKSQIGWGIVTLLPGLFLGYFGFFG